MTKHWAYYRWYETKSCSLNMTKTLYANYDKQYREFCNAFYSVRLWEFINTHKAEIWNTFRSVR